jgi:hypothetical protein
MKIFVVPLLFRKGSLRSFRLERQRAFGYDERNFSSSAFDLASKVGMLQSTRTQLDQLKVPYQDLISERNDFGFRNRGCRRRYGITKKKRELVLAETELNN